LDSNEDIKTNKNKELKIIETNNFLSAVSEYYDNLDYYSEVIDKMQNQEEFRITENNFLFKNNADKQVEKYILRLTKNQIEAIVYGLPKIIDIFTMDKITPLIKLRYRKYMFRIIYVLWQDNYDKIKFRNFFLYVVNNPKTVNYVDEIKFTIDQLRTMALTNQMENKLVEFARSEKLDMAEFLKKHKIRRDSVLAIDVMSIFFLFCTANDYLEFGNERLIIAIMRCDINNQAKILNNMVKKTDAEQRNKLTDVFQFFIHRYVYSVSESNKNFWDLIMPDVKETVYNEFLHDS